LRVAFANAGRLEMMLFWLALSAFAIGTETFLLTGLLPMLSADLGFRRQSRATRNSVRTDIRDRLAYSGGALQPISIARPFSCRSHQLCSANLSAGFSLNFGHLVAARVLMALAAGLFMPTANAVAVLYLRRNIAGAPSLPSVPA